MKSQPLQFSTRPGPSGPKEITECHSNFARRKFCKIQQVRVPRYRGSRGRASWRREACRTADCARPLASFGSFSTRKRNSPPGRRNSLCIPGKETDRGGGGEPPPYRVLLTMLVPWTAPSSGPSGHLPPRGKARKNRRRNSPNAQSHGGRPGVPPLPWKRKSSCNLIHLAL